MKTLAAGSNGNFGKKFPLVSGSSKKVRATQPIGLQDLETESSLFISLAARQAAVRKGEGVMIGDYFVGVTTGTDLLFSHPAIVY